MDTITHALAGSAISDGWFRKRLGPVATPFALAMSALPDVDAVTYLVAPEYAWAHHRGYSHSFFVFLFAAPLFGYLGYRLSARTGTWRRWTVLAFLCLVSHTLGDLVTSWGTMPLLPFSNARLSWDVIPIIDAFMTSTTGMSFLLNRLLRRERVERFLNPVSFPLVHEHPRRRKAADVVGRVCVVLVIAYLAVGWHQNRQTAREARKELAAAGIEAVEVRALPFLFTYVAYGIAARDAGGTVYNASYSTWAPKPMEFERFPTASGPAVDAALATPEGGMFAWYSQGMYVAEAEPDGAGTRVRLRDRRFFSPWRPRVSRFVMEFDVDAAGAAFRARSIQMGPEEIDIAAELRALWNVTRYGEANPPGGEPDTNPIE